MPQAQEKAAVCRTEKRWNPQTGQPYPWLVRSTAMVNHYYFYSVDRDFGPFFLKFCSYFPYNAKLCLNGHEYVTRQLAQRKIAAVALDNGLLRGSPAAARALRRPVGGDDRGVAAQVAGPLAASLCPRNRRAGYRSVVMPDAAQDDAPLRRAFAHLEHAVDQRCAKAKLAA